MCKPRTVIVAGLISVEQVLLEKIGQVNLKEPTPTDTYISLHRCVVSVASELKIVEP